MQQHVHIEFDTTLPEPPQRARSVLGADLRRTWLIAQLLIPVCPDCAAAPGDACDYLLLPATELIRVSPPLTFPPVTIHTNRADLAIGKRLVSRAELLGQFEDQKPHLT